jgi:uncharacterized beta-barrel protein YwiB (DUF1934 family)
MLKVRTGVDILQPVIVEVESVQVDEFGKKEEISFVTEGELYDKNVAYYLRYKEELIEGEETTTTLKIKEKRLTLIRDGAVRMKQEFRAGESSSFAYQIPYGQWDFELIVDKVDIKTNNQVGNIKLEYTLEDRGKLITKNQLFITYKEDTNG